MLLTSSRKLDETPPHNPVSLTRARRTRRFSVTPPPNLHHFFFSFPIPDTGTKDWGAHAGEILADKGHVEEDEGKASGRCLHVSALLQTVENECP